MKKLLDWMTHRWRLFIDPPYYGLVGMGPKGKWRVRYDDGETSIPMTYGTACEYAEMFPATVERWERNHQ